MPAPHTTVPGFESCPRFRSSSLLMSTLGGIQALCPCHPRGRPDGAAGSGSGCRGYSGVNLRVTDLSPSVCHSALQIARISWVTTQTRTASQDAPQPPRQSLPAGARGSPQLHAKLRGPLWQAPTHRPKQAPSGLVAWSSGTRFTHCNGKNDSEDSEGPVISFLLRSPPGQDVNTHDVCVRAAVGATPRFPDGTPLRIPSHCHYHRRTCAPSAPATKGLPSQGSQTHSQP